MDYIHVGLTTSQNSSAFLPVSRFT